MTTTSEITFWHTMTFRDADRMTAWLSAVGFTEHATYRDDTDPSVVVHAEWVGHGGGLMFGSARPGGAVVNTGQAAAYLVVRDPEAWFEAAIAAGGTALLPMETKDYGGRGGSVADPEGNHWSVGDYQAS